MLLIQRNKPFIFSTFALFKITTFKSIAFETRSFFTFRYHIFLLSHLLFKKYAGKEIIKKKLKNKKIKEKKPCTNFSYFIFYAKKERKNDKHIERSKFHKTESNILFYDENISKRKEIRRIRKLFLILILNLEKRRSNENGS